MADEKTVLIAYAESPAMTRSDVAKARRSMQDLGHSLELVQRQLLNVPVDQTNALEVAERLLAASRLKETLKQTQAAINESLPHGKGKLSDEVRQEIAGFYLTGQYTQETLADQYNVSQSTVHEIVTKHKSEK
ncbi:hypothetical protein [Paraburkholderia fungorum]|uniref:hypothetical protein n=1 Tax=Paraburkholderia fungorum TaxID=134537 RepID=UPI001C1EFCFF|nr:hypothetical protein [Paraburkholderia fungorum]MBU7442159.1 hypothetical protein [Paraburkholderia fungorum]